MIKYGRGFMNPNRRGYSPMASQVSRPGPNLERRRFVSPDSPVTGRSVVVSESPSIPVVPMVPLVPAPRRPAPMHQNPRCLTELFNSYKGKTVKVTISPGARGEVIEKTGVLIYAGPGHIALRELNERNLMVFDISLIKIVNIYDAF